MRRALIVCLALLCAPARAQEAKPPLLMATLVDAQGSEVGTARIEGGGGAAVVTLSTGRLGKGPHPVRLHAGGICDAAGGFVSAGPELAPAQDSPADAPIAGPPLLTPDSAGDAKSTITLRQVALIAPAGKGQTLLLDDDGLTIVVHSPPGPDGQKRLQCGSFLEVPQ